MILLHDPPDAHRLRFATPASIPPFWASTRSTTRSTRSSSANSARSTHVALSRALPARPTRRSASRCGARRPGAPPRWPTRRSPRSASHLRAVLPSPTRLPSRRCSARPVSRARTPRTRLSRRRRPARRAGATHSSSGTTVAVGGFYDGGQVWRARFTCSRPGIWHWRTGVAAAEHHQPPPGVAAAAAAAGVDKQLAGAFRADGAVECVMPAADDRRPGADHGTLLVDPAHPHHSGTRSLRSGCEAVLRWP